VRDKKRRGSRSEEPKERVGNPVSGSRAMKMKIDTKGEVKVREKREGTEDLTRKR